MRHIFGLFFGVVVAAAVLFGAGWANTTLWASPVATDVIEEPRSLIAFGILAVVGLLVGVVLSGRVSPLAAFVPSMVLLAWTVVYMIDFTRAQNLAPIDPALQKELFEAGQGMMQLLISGMYGMLGIALFIPVLMPTRWARRHHEEDDEYEETQPEYY